jgi:hypothetical protein
MANSEVTYGTQITTSSQLIDALNSQRVFFSEHILNQLEPDISPFLTLLRNINKEKALGDIESYVENRSSWITDKAYYVKASDTTAISALAANAAEYSGLAVSATPAGTALATPFKNGDVLVLIDNDDESRYATIIVSATDDADEVKFKLLTATPGFDITADGATATKLYQVSRNFGEGSDESDHRYEIPYTFWNEVSSFKESYKITHQLKANKQVVWGNVLLTQMKAAQQRIYRDIDRSLLYASQRINCTNPFSVFGSAPLLDKDGNVVRTSVSMEQAIRAAETVGIDGTSRFFKMTKATMTPDLFDQNMAAIYRYPLSAKNKYIFCGEGAYLAINSFVRKYGDYQIGSGETMYGIDIKTLLTASGTHKLVKHPGMTGRMSNAMMIIDMNNVQLRELIPMYTEKLVDNGTVDKWEIRNDVGLRVRFPESHGMIYFV